jgi:YD repeat-containing protein
VTTTFTYDTDGRLLTKQLPTSSVTYAYTADGSQKTVTYPNGIITRDTGAYPDPSTSLRTKSTCRRNALNRLIYFENWSSDGTIISSYTYTLDNAGNRTRVVEHTGRVVDYTYDATDKLLEERITNPDTSVSVTSYTYDNVGNRLTKVENGFTTTYQYDANNRLVQEDDADGDVRYYYDDNGNLTEKESAEEDVLYVYDAENHLIRVETTRFGATIVVEYEYDAAGNRVKKTIDDTVVINYLVDTNRDYAQVLEERDESSSVDRLPPMSLQCCVKGDGKGHSSKGVTRSVR